MNRKISITIIALLLALPGLAQSSTKLSYAPQQGDFQATLLFGSGSFFNNTWSGNYEYLLPSSLSPSGNIGDVGLSDSDFRYYLNPGDLNTNNVANMIGVNFSYFIFSNWDVSLMFAMNLNLTPGKDYVEGDYSVDNMPIPGMKYISASITNAYTVEVGSNYRFTVGNERISPYVGGFAGWQMARITASYPYTGETMDSDGEPIELYRNDYRAGQEWAIRAGAMAGVDFAVAPGLILGFEVSPVAYQYSMVSIHPSGLTPWRAVNHSIKFFSQPRLKLGIRF